MVNGLANSVSTFKIPVKWAFIINIEQNLRILEKNDIVDFDRKFPKSFVP